MEPANISDTCHRSESSEKNGLLSNLGRAELSGQYEQKFQLTGNATILDNPGQNGHRVAHFDAC
jgi:hypothetical protein